MVGEDHLLLGAEVSEERGPADTGARGDVVDRGVVEAPFAEERESRVDQTLRDAIAHGLTFPSDATLTYGTEFRADGTSCRTGQEQRPQVQCGPCRSIDGAGSFGASTQRRRLVSGSAVRLGDRLAGADAAFAVSRTRCPSLAATDPELHSPF